MYLNVYWEVIDDFINDNSNCVYVVRYVEIGNMGW